MTKFSDEFVCKVQKFWKEGQSKKQSDNDQIFTIKDVIKNFNRDENGNPLYLSYAQISRILYVRKVDL